MTRADFRRVYGPPEWRAYWEQRGCLICGDRRIQIAHVRTGGMGRKADWTATIGLCDGHHREHHRGAATFEARYRIDLRATAYTIATTFQRGEHQC